MNLAEEIKKKTDPEIIYGVFLNKTKKEVLVFDIELAVEMLEDIGEKNSVTSLTIHRLKQHLSFLKQS